MGSGFKDFAAGDILTANDVDGYLMRQTVMTFADASARDSALSGVLDEGMTAYLEDSNTVTIYDGSNWITQPQVSVSTPFRIAAGANYGGASSTTVTYPAGRFTVNPINIFVNSDSNTVHPRITANSTTSFTYINSVSANQTLVYIAIQMTSSAAAG